MKRVVSFLIAAALIAGMIGCGCDRVNVHSAVDSSNAASAMSLNTSQGYVTPMVVAGYDHTVGLRFDGTVVAVGWNNEGQCNVGDWTDIVQITAGWSHTVGLRFDGTVVAVGWNDGGQCDVGNWTDIVQVDAGQGYTLGLKSDGTVVAASPGSLGEDISGWGNITQIAACGGPALGLKSDGTVVAVGTCNVSGWTDIIEVAGGYNHVMGLKSDGTVVAVGENDYGECNVNGWTDIVQIDAGEYHTVGLRSDGTVVAAGWNGYGACDVGGWTDIVQVTAGWGHTVGIKADGTVIAVGHNCYGQCNVAGWTDIIQIAAGGLHTVGLESDGTVVAVGRNNFGECDVGGWTDIIQVAAGSHHTVGLKSDGTVVAVPEPHLPQYFLWCDVGNWTDIVQVDGGLEHTVGLRSNGTVIVVRDPYHPWGQDNVGNWTDIIQIAAGYKHTVGLKSDGTVVAVGDNTYGQCNVGGWTDIIQVSTLGWHTVGLKSDGTVVAVGRHDDGQCDVDGWTDIIQVSAGYFQTVGLKPDGTVVAVGQQWRGQCSVEDWADIVQVAAGGWHHTVGLRADGTVVAAGPEIELAKILLLIQAKLNSPAEIRIYDSQGHVTGVVDGEVRDDIRWATFNQENTGITTLYGFDTYFYEVEGISSGNYGLTVDAVNEGQATTFKVINIPITPGAIHRYHIDWYGLAEGEPGITIEKDHNGDEEIDEIIITSIPTPTNPSPINDATDVPLDQTLSWVGEDFDTVTYDVYFGTETNPPLVSEGQTQTTYVPTLDLNTTYYWRVTGINEHSIYSAGSVWKFTTMEAELPTTYPTVTTQAATNITTNSTTLNMNYAMGDFSSVEVRFAYKKSTDSAWSSTEWVSKSQDGTHAQSLTGIDSSTKYEFKAQLKYNDIVIEGTTLQFTTDTPSDLPSSEGCFIATAAYGTPMTEEIHILREFRDEHLLTNPLGQALVDLYYRVSPPIAEFITEHPSLKPIVRAGLLPAVVIGTVAVNTTPAEKVVMIGLLLLVSVAVAIWAMRRRRGGPEYS